MEYLLTWPFLFQWPVGRFLMMLTELVLITKFIFLEKALFDFLQRLVHRDQKKQGIQARGYERTIKMRKTLIQRTMRRS